MSLIEPHWKPAKLWLPKRLNEIERAWLLVKGSMTKQLERASQQLTVHVLKQSWQYPLTSEQRILSLQTRQLALQRVVELSCDGVVWMYAWSLFPVTMLTGKEQFFRYLGNKPLGKVLFRNPTVIRGPIELAQLTAQNYHFKQATERLTTVPQKLWARRSVFYLSGKPLLVNEIFLPHVFEL